MSILMTQRFTEDALEAAKFFVSLLPDSGVAAWILTLGLIAVSAPGQASPIGQTFAREGTGRLLGRADQR